jgi:hypothetical protein
VTRGEQTRTATRAAERLEVATEEQRQAGHGWWALSSGEGAAAIRALLSDLADHTGRDERTLLETQARVIYIARCPEHGLHGERDECFVCGGEVEQVPFVPLEQPVSSVVAEAAQAIRDVALLFPSGSPLGLSLRSALAALLVTSGRVRDEDAEAGG